MGIGAVGGLVLPVLLQVGWPVSAGMAGATRILLVGSLSMANGIMCAICCALSAQLEPRTKAGNAALQIGLPLALWAAFVFS